MILVDRAILAALSRGDIVIRPFDRKALGTNSYDVHLGRTIMTLKPPEEDHYFDVAKPVPVREHVIPDDGMVLYPGQLYLAVTEEYTETHRHVPFLEGKSSLGRLGCSIHVTAGKGDVGFCNHWTMEITVVHPLLVRPGMPVGQLIFFESSGESLVPYSQKPTAKYNGHDPKPQPSQMWRNFRQE